MLRIRVPMSTSLSSFIQQEMQKRHMSQRQFAMMVGVSNQTISRAVSFNNDNFDPSLEFLAKLARATHVDICTLVALIYPEDSSISGRARLLAERIDRLPPEVQEIIDVSVPSVGSI